MNTLTLGERMKTFYELRSQNYLLRKVPVILRLDGKAFHTFTKQKQCIRPFDDNLNNAFVDSCKFLLENIQGSYIIYHQSDEISILLLDTNKDVTSALFDYKVQKLTSVSASMLTYIFNKSYISDIPAYFDSRVFNIPLNEVPNYFIWRQQDCIRNSVNSYARAFFSQKQLHGKNVLEVKEMLIKNNKDWENINEKFKYGTFLIRNENGFITINEKLNYEDILKHIRI